MKFELKKVVSIAAVATLAAIAAGADARTFRSADVHNKDFPTNMAVKSPPVAGMKCTLHSPASALARRVFPVPGGPDSRTPFGGRAPRATKPFGSAR